MFAAGKDSTQQNRRIDGGDFGIPNSFSSVNVGEVVEESAMVRQLLPKESEGGKNAFQRSVAGNQASLFADAESGQTKAGRGNTGHDRVVSAVDVAPVFHHPCLGAGLVPKITEVGDFQFVQKFVVFERQNRQT